MKNNQITTLPESISIFKSLEELDLRNNQLTTLPDSIVNLKSLMALYLDGNPLDEKTNIILKQLEKNGVDVSK